MLAEEVSLCCGKEKFMICHMVNILVSAGDGRNLLGIIHN